MSMQTCSAAALHSADTAAWRHSSAGSSTRHSVSEISSTASTTAGDGGSDATVSASAWHVRMASWHRTAKSGGACSPSMPNIPGSLGCASAARPGTTLKGLMGRSARAQLPGPPTSAPEVTVPAPSQLAATTAEQRGGSQQAAADLAARIKMRGRPIVTARWLRLLALSRLLENYYRRLAAYSFFWMTAGPGLSASPASLSPERSKDWLTMRCTDQYANASNASSATHADITGVESSAMLPRLAPVC
mmetsp:Transcript_29226/g.73276  ORF Transcript_29226/g.73276 Transcript_29226/m.73276 type:complete len:247 (+) Transcript_29226:1194-1934(+)